MQSTLRAVPQRKAFCFSGPLQNELLARNFQEEIMEALSRAHYGLRVVPGSDSASLVLINYK